MKRINHIRNRDKVKRSVTSNRYIKRHTVLSYIQEKKGKGEGVETFLLFCYNKHGIELNCFLCYNNCDVNFTILFGENFSFPLSLYNILKDSTRNGAIFVLERKIMYKQKRRYENMEKIIFDGVGKYNIPAIKKTLFNSTNFISFNYAKTCKKREDKSVHFFIDDYQFERVWVDPDKYVNMLKEFKQVLSPDFSTYIDFPKALQIYNHFRKHWIGKYMQIKGIDVIPTISWSDKESFEWCFDGEPLEGVVAVSSVGCMKNKESKKLFLEGYNEMIKRLCPETIIFYGNIPDECKGNIVKVNSFQEKFKEVKCSGW